MNDEKDNLPFIFKTIAGEDEIRMRGLAQLGETLQIAYTLFLDGFFTEETGDPFHGQKGDKAFYDTFNRALIETTIDESKLYGEVKFDDTYLAASSQGIEECLMNLEVIWLAVNGLEKENKKRKPDVGEPSAVIKISMAVKLSYILQYFLTTIHNMIGDIRIRQLEVKLSETPEENRKAFLLRNKTDLLKKKYGIEPIHMALLKVIDLELDLIRQLEGNHQTPAQMGVKNDLPIDIDKDFAYELSLTRYPFRSLVENNPMCLAELKRQFSLLPATPKLHWYFNEFISDDEWEAHCTSTHSMSKTSSREIVAANFIADTETEIKAKQVIREFEEMQRKDSVDLKYYGRFIKDTELVKTLTSLDEKLTEFKEYVFNDKNIDNYSTYAKAVTKSILLTTNKLSDISLKLALLDSVLSLSIETDLRLAIRLFGQHKDDHTEINRRFKILKVLADEYVTEAIDKLSHPETTTAAIPATLKITLTDKIKRELDIIATIYESQNYVYPDEDSHIAPLVLDKDGRSGINGRYIQHMDIYSDLELFNIQQFKSQITERYEASTNHTLLLNQLKEIQLKALSILQCYQRRLTTGNQIVDDFLKDHQRPLNERIDNIDNYHTLVFVDNLRITSIVLGVERGEYQHQRTRPGSFNYSATNASLVEVCRHISDFIGLFKLNEISVIKPPKAAHPDSEFLFKDNAETEFYLNALRLVSPPVVDLNGHYILGKHQKGAVVAWMDWLVHSGKLNLSLSRERRTALINQLVPGLEISLKSLFSSNGRALQHYATEFSKVLKDI